MVYFVGVFSKLQRYIFDDITVGSASKLFFDNSLITIQEGTMALLTNLFTHP